MTRQETTDLFLAAMHEHGPTFGVRLLIGFLKGVEGACILEELKETAELAGGLAQSLEIVATLTARLEEMI